MGKISHPSWKVRNPIFKIGPVGPIAYVIIKVAYLIILIQLNTDFFGKLLEML